MRDTATGHRRTIRMKGYDYATAGAYFVTICTQDRACVFGDVADGEMRLNAAGEMVRDELARTPMVRPEMQVDACVVMPNHVHVVVRIVGAYGDTPVQAAHGDTPNAGARGDDGAYIDTPVQAANGDVPARGGRIPIPVAHNRGNGAWVQIRHDETHQCVAWYARRCHMAAELLRTDYPRPEIVEPRSGVRFGESVPMADRPR